MAHSQKENDSVEILMSTVNNNRLSMDVENYVIINQLTDESISQVEKEHVFTYREKGLSRSRNRALEHADGDICLLADEDVRFVPDVEAIVGNAFEENPEADIITFQVITPEGEAYKKYPLSKYRHDSESLMNISSIEIAFRRKKVMDKKLQFDERFGLGAPFPTGEEFIFLMDALKAGLNILFVPEVIVIHPKESSGKNWRDPDQLKAKGALFYRIFGWKALYRLIILSYKNYGDSEFSFITYFSCLLDGIHDYKKTGEHRDCRREQP